MVSGAPRSNLRITEPTQITETRAAELEAERHRPDALVFIPQRGLSVNKESCTGSKLHRFNVLRRDVFSKC